MTGTAVSKWIAERLEPAPDSPQATAANEGPGTTEKKGKKPTIAEILTGIGMALELWHDSTQTGFATIGRLSHPIRSKGFRHCLLSEFRRQCPDQMPNAEALNVALMMLEAAAVFDGPEHPVYARIAGHGGKVYLFLGDPKNTVIEIDSSGWRCCENPPVRFRRPAGSCPLPMPVRGGSIQDLRAHLNVPDDGVFALIVGWLMGCFYPDGPFPVMVLVGEQGSAKTTTARVLKRLIDPSTAVVRCEPREARDLMIQARNNWVLATDNLSHLPPWLSDAMCRLATGGGFSTRELYSNDDEIIFDSKRPQVVNGIEDFVTRPDLLERSIIVRHPTIPEEKRRPESHIWAAFDNAHPRILGAVLDRVSVGLRHLPELRLERLPRMADFALFAVACEGGEVDPKGRSAFFAAYTENQAGAHEQALESSPLPAAVVALMTDRFTWEGPGSDLLRELEKHAQQPLPKDWPKKPNVLTNKLRRLAPDIRRVHRLNVNCDGRASDRARKRIVQITRLMDSEGNPSSAPSTPLESGEFTKKHPVDSGRSPDGVPGSADDPRPNANDGRGVGPSDGILGKAGTSDSADGGSRPRSRRRFRSDDREADRRGD